MDPVCRTLTTLCVGAIFLLTVSQALPVQEQLSKHSIRIKRSTDTDSNTLASEVIHGHDIELECEANGPSPPIIHWLFNGRHVEQGPLDHIAENLIPPLSPVSGARNASARISHDYMSISTLVIKRAARQNAGTYTCVADLPGTRNTKNYVISVSTPSPVITALQASKRSGSSATVANHTRIYLYTDTVFEFEGVSTLLVCRATQGFNKPVPSITWTVNALTITSRTPGYKIESNGDLKILRTEKQHHLAEIKCRAVGEGGAADEKAPFLYLFEESS